MHTIGRFAPSPSGRMHLGNVLCALLAWLSARQQNGEFLLRIEDLGRDALSAQLRGFNYRRPAVVRV